MSDGWVSIHRKIENNPLWLSEKFTRAQAWLDLIIFANYEDGYFYVRGSRVDVKRGQIGWSQVTMAKRWQWHRGKVAGFLKMLENEHQIVQHKSTLTTVLTIINYDRFQHQNVQQPVQQPVQQSDSRTYTNNKNNKNNKKNKSNFLHSVQDSYTDDSYERKNKVEKKIIKSIDKNKTIEDQAWDYVLKLSAAQGRS